jgi:hypothetical protein
MRLRDDCGVRDVSPENVFCRSSEQEVTSVELGLTSALKKACRCLKWFIFYRGSLK